MFFKHSYVLNMESLIGRKFKRNKYGLSDWVETVTKVYFMNELQKGWEYTKLIPYVENEKGFRYRLDEVVFELSPVANKLKFYCTSRALKADDVEGCKTQCDSCKRCDSM